MDAKAEDFLEPLQVAGILESLQIRAYEEKLGERENRGTAALADGLIDAFLMRSCYGSPCAEHRALRLPAYVKLKAREAANLTKQFQLRHAREGDYPALSEAEVKSRVFRLNRKRRVYGQMCHRLRFFGLLDGMLRQVGSRFPAMVIQNGSDKLLAHVRGFGRPALLERNGHDVYVGQELNVFLRGFSVEDMAFTFGAD